MHSRGLKTDRLAWECLKAASIIPKLLLLLTIYIRGTSYDHFVTSGLSNILKMSPDGCVEKCLLLSTLGLFHTRAFRNLHLNNSLKTS